MERDKKLKIGRIFILLGKFSYSFDYVWILAIFLSNNEGLK